MSSVCRNLELRARQLTFRSFVSLAKKGFVGESRGESTLRPNPFRLSNLSRVSMPSHRRPINRAARNCLMTPDHESGGQKMCLRGDLAPPAGVEPTTYRLGGGRSIH